MLTAAGVAGFFLLFGFVIYLGFRAAKHDGIVSTQNDTLKAGAKTDAKTQEILARPPADRDAIDKWLRGDGK